MTQFLSKRRAMGLLAASNLLALLGCQLITGTPTPAPAPTQASGAPATEISEGLPAPELPLTTGPVFGPGGFNLSAPIVGLADLSSYRVTLTITFDGTRDGQPEQWSHIYVMLVNREAAASQITIDTTGEAASQLFYAEVNGALYERKADAGAPCTVSVVEEGESLAQLWEPASYLAPVLGADEAGSDPVDGIPANRYTFDERAIGAAGVATSIGEIWVEAEAGYILRYTLTSTGSADYFGEGREGTATWNYELSEINQPIAIDLPVDCPIGLLDVPLLPDVSNTLNIPGMINFTTAVSMSEAAAFYQEQLPALGWQLLEEPSITDDSTLLEFSQGTQTLSVIITTDETGTAVLIVAEPIVP